MSVERSQFFLDVVVCPTYLQLGVIFFTSWPIL